MPNASVSLAKNTTVRFKIKISQDGSVLTPPSSIAAGSSNSTIAGITRQADEAGRAVYHLAGLNAGTASIEIGSGTGKFVLDTTVTPPVPGPLVFELDSTFDLV